MSGRPHEVKPVSKRVKNDEMEPLAEVYAGMLGEPGVLALFSAEDATVDGVWMAAFESAIAAVGNIVASRTIIQLNRDVTSEIRKHSKRSVKYGKVLSYFLRKAFKGQAGLIDSFGVVRANNKMRSGDTEGFAFEVNTIIQQIGANEAALVAKGWKVQNRSDYEELARSVMELNTKQELAKQLVPDNTDSATRVRNECYGFIQTLLRLKDIVYYEEREKRRQWMVATILKHMRRGLVN